MRRVLFLPGAGGDPAFWAPARTLAVESVRLAWPGLGNQPPRDDVRGLDDLVRMTRAHMDEPVDLVMTTVNRRQVVQVLLPAAHWPPATTLADLSSAVRRSTEKTGSCV